MELQSHNFNIKKTARYFTSGNIEEAKYLLIALHGYGQLPPYFLNKFEGLSADYFILAPEGMHRFYLNGTSGRVGASWMTKEARLDDMADTNQYLKALLEDLKSKKHFEKIVLLGFSQGGATAARFYAEFPEECDQLIMWASVFPPDIQMEKELLFKDSKNQPIFVLGSNDEFISGDSQEKIIELYDSIGFRIKTFIGTHIIELATLNELLHSDKNK